MFYLKEKISLMKEGITRPSSLKLPVRTIGNQNLFTPHWADYINITRRNQLIFNLSIADLDTQEVEAFWLPFEKWVAQQSEEYTFSISTKTYPANQEWQPDERGASVKKGINDFWWSQGDAKGVSQYVYGLSSRWIPSKYFQPDMSAQLAKTFFDASRFWDLRVFVGKGQYGASASALQRGQATSMNPVVFDSPVLIIIGAIEEFAFPNVESHKPDVAKARDVAGKVKAAGNILRQATPESGSYVNEASYTEPNWQQSFWGDNYGKLFEIKKKYDPHNVLSCQHCVGSGVVSQ